MHKRDEQLRLAEALANPQTIDEIIMALSAPDNLSPFKKQMIDWIVQEVTLEEFIEKLFLVLEVTKAKEEARRQDIIQTMRDDASAEQLSSLRIRKPQPILPRQESEFELESKIDSLNKLLAAERKKKQEYENTIVKCERQSVKIDTRWTERQTTKAKEYCNELVENLTSKKLELKNVDLSPKGIEYIKERVTQAYVTPPPSKLAELNAPVIKDIVKENKEPEQAKKAIAEVSKSMAYKNDFVRNLKVLSELDRMEKGLDKQPDSGVVEEANLKPSDLIKLQKKVPLKSTVAEDKTDIEKAVKLKIKKDEAQENLKKIDYSQKVVNAMTDKLTDMKNEAPKSEIPPAPPPPPPAIKKS